MGHMRAFCDLSGPNQPTWLVMPYTIQWLRPYTEPSTSAEHVMVGLISGAEVAVELSLEEVGARLDAWSRHEAEEPETQETPLAKPAKARRVPRKARGG